jgi:hypothetical protein
MRTVTYLERKSFKEYFEVHLGGSHGRDRMIVGFIATYAISANVVSSNPAQVRCMQYNIIFSGYASFRHEYC